MSVSLCVTLKDGFNPLCYFGLHFYLINFEWKFYHRLRFPWGRRGTKHKTRVLRNSVCSRTRPWLRPQYKSFNLRQNRLTLRCVSNILIPLHGSDINPSWGPGPNLDSGPTFVRVRRLDLLSASASL